MGVLYCYWDKDKGLLPDYIKNIRVYAVRSFETFLALHPAYIAPKEYYTGFMKGYLHGYELYCDSLL